MLSLVASFGMRTTLTLAGGLGGSALGNGLGRILSKGSGRGGSATIRALTTTLFSGLSAFGTELLCQRLIDRRQDFRWGDAVGAGVVAAITGGAAVFASAAREVGVLAVSPKGMIHLAETRGADLSHFRGEWTRLAGFMTLSDQVSLPYRIGTNMLIGGTSYGIGALVDEREITFTGCASSAITDAILGEGMTRVLRVFLRRLPDPVAPEGEFVAFPKERFQFDTLRDRIDGTNFSDIYWARDSWTGQRVVIKREKSIPMPEGVDQGAMTMTTEIEVCRRLAPRRSPFVTRGLGYFQDEKGVRFLVLEPFYGIDLARYLQRETDRNTRARLSPQEGVELFIKVLKGLRVAHAEEVLHRDIKPENIGLAGFLFDWGSAEFIPPGQRSIASLYLKGTDNYMAPESFMGLIDPDLTEVSFSSDLHVVALCLYEAIAGKPPFDYYSRTGTLFSMIRAILQDPPISLSHWYPDASVTDRAQLDALDLIFKKGLAYQPKERYQTADEMTAALEEWMDRGRRGSNPQPPP